MARERYRLKFEFWLEPSKPDHEQVADQIELLKNERQFASAVRNGIRLIADLSAGRVDVLLELFPFVRAELSGGGAGGDSGVDERIAQLERALMSSVGGPKPLNIAPVAGPVTDGDDDLPVLTVVKSEGADSLASQNFLESAWALQ